MAWSLLECPIDVSNWLLALVESMQVATQKVANKLEKTWNETPPPHPACLRASRNSLGQYMRGVAGVLVDGACSGGSDWLPLTGQVTRLVIDGLPRICAGSGCEGVSQGSSLSYLRAKECNLLAVDSKGRICVHFHMLGHCPI